MQVFLVEGCNLLQADGIKHVEQLVPHRDQMLLAESLEHAVDVHRGEAEHVAQLGLDHIQGELAREATVA